MAKDLMRMLTEITPTQQPTAAVPGTPSFRGMFGQQQAQRLQGSLGSLARGGAPSAQARMGQALSGLDLTKEEDLATLAKIQQGTGDLAGAAQTAAKIQAMRQAEVSSGYRQRAEQREIERLAAEKARGRKMLSQDYERISNAEEAAEKADGEAAKALNLVSRYARFKPTGGVIGKAWSATKEFLGGQTAVDSLKTEFDNLISVGIINNLPPGVASDRDIAIIQKGFPNKDWNAKEIERFLKAMAKVSAFNAERNKEKAKYLNDNRGNQAGFTQYWQDLKKSEGYAEQVAQQYNLPGFDIPAKPMTWDAQVAADTLTTSSVPTQASRRDFR